MLAGKGSVDRTVVSVVPIIGTSILAGGAPLLGFGFIRKIFFLVVLLLVGAVVFLVYVDKIAKAGLEEGGKYALETPVTVESVDVAVLSHDGVGLKGLSIANPKGFGTTPFLKVAEAKMAVPFKNLLEDKVEIASIVIKDVNVVIEKKDGKTNFQALVDSLKRLQSKGEDTSSKRYIVKELLITDVSVAASVGPAVIPVKISKIEMKDLGVGGKGMTMAEVFGRVIEAVLQETAIGGSSFLPKDLLQDLSTNVGVLNDVRSKAGKLIENVGGALDGIFKGKK